MGRQIVNWKTVLALAVLAMTLAYCELESRKFESEEKIVCIEKRGEWSNSYGGTCNFD